jgi:hypothetical protein
MYNIIYYCIDRVSPRIYASVPAVVHRKNQRMQDLLLLDRNLQWQISRGIVPLSCAILVVCGDVKSRKRTYSFRSYPICRTNCPSGSYFLELFGTHRAHFIYPADRDGHYISIGNIIYYPSRPGLNFTASYDDFRM